ncbi:MAG: TDP-N-acetylfucosamine:lipid II N-acetylfucosaminyltransferase [Sulfurimonas sp.]|nr:TDP-N-acetylfucosamine:lipid II N-acetylfucosaminyltransferase [Sulfurimonas sp.]
MQNSNKMNSRKILHVMVVEKFLAPYIDFVDEHFGREGHHYVFITSEKYQYGLTPEHNVEFLHTDDDIFITLLAYIKMAKKIILHGLWRDKVDVLLYFNQEFLKKCYWVMWGGDFYFPETKSKIRHEIIKNMGYLLTGMEGEVELIRKEYQAKGKHIKLSVGYPSNIFEEHKYQIKSLNTINILVGNSATQTNNHLKIFDKLLPFKNEKIKIYVPLSYGDKSYAKEIEKIGHKYFGEQLIPLFNFMSNTEYTDFLSNIHIAIFNHSRQQGIGNIIKLLGLGKKVFIRNDITSWEYFEKLGIKIFDNRIIDLSILDNDTKKNNRKKIKKIFSEKKLRNEMKKIY